MLEAYGSVAISGRRAGQLRQRLGVQIPTRSYICFKIIAPLGNSATMSTLTVHHRSEDETAQERTGHSENKGKCSCACFLSDNYRNITL